jgi:outer membrane protein assembly factor BamB
MRMKNVSIFTAFVILSFVFIPGINAQEKKGTSNWPQWRGSLGTGVALKANPPTEFNESKNLKWKTEIPGKGHATPIVWGDKIIIQTAVPTDEKIKVDESTASEGQQRMSGTKTDAVHEYRVILVNRETGKIEWQTTVAREKPQESTHELGSWASNSPCTDGEFIYAYFGSRGLFCLDFSGKVIWERDFGQMQKHMSFGEGESPYLYKDKIFILWDHEGESFIYAIDKNTGKDVWKKEREERTSWSSPFVVEVKRKATGYYQRNYPD